MRWVKNYLDLRKPSGRSKRVETDAVSGGTLSTTFQYIAIVLGILVQKYWSLYRENGGQWVFAGFWGWLLFAIITAVVIFPAVYKNSIDPTQPVFVQFCLIFTAGMGWQAIANNAIGT